MRILLIVFLLIFSCSSKKDVLLIQDTKSALNYNYEYEVLKIQPDDILRINILSKSASLSSLYEKQQLVGQNSSMLGYQIEGFLVDSNGFVNIPVLPAVLVKNLTIKEASDKIRKLLDQNDIIRNAVVDIKILNAYFTVLGEVRTPGRYSFLENNMNILQALGIAGDLTINGKRDDIRIISKKDGNMIVKSVNLTSSKSLVTDGFQIFPGDIIIVNANNARVKNAGVVGNFGNLLSVMSFILSSIILISNN
tara:strand:+ start:358 stop:1110 length:753 start_codon:yes stop_codon:yes gene_type:complete